jgi:hypothetical protein
MTFGRRGFLGILCVTILFVLPARPASAQQVDLTPEQIEAFLLKARIVSTRSAGSGVTARAARRSTDGGHHARRAHPDREHLPAGLRGGARARR